MMMIMFYWFRWWWLCFILRVWSLGTLHYGIRAKLRHLALWCLHAYLRKLIVVTFCSYFLYSRKTILLKLQEDMAGRRSPTPPARVEPNNEDAVNNNIVNIKTLQIVRDLLRLQPFSPNFLNFGPLLMI